MPTLAQDILDREACLKTERQMLDSLIQRINQYVTPYDFDPNVETMEGDEKGQSILDGTGQDGLATAVNTIISSIIPTDTRNFSLVPEDEDLKEIDEVNKWYDTVSNIVFRAISTSNIRAVSHPVIHDLYSKGTGCLMMGNAADNSRLIFRAYPIGSYVISENDEGIIDTIFRRSKMTIRTVEQMRKKLGKRASLADSTRRKLDEKPDDKITILHAVYPRENVDISKITGTTAVTKYPFASVWIDADEKHVIHEGGFLSNPYKVARWSQYPGFPYGFSPLMNVLADIKTLNKLKELGLRSINFAVDPTVLMSDREPLLKKGKKFRRHPGDVIPMRDINGMKPFELGTRIDVADFVIKDLQMAILKGLGVDRMQIEPASGDTQRSATEIAHRIATNNRQLGPGLSKLEDELLEPIVLTTFVLLGQAGKLPPPPPEVMRDGSFLNLSVRFEGSLARQARQIDLEALFNFFTVLSGALQVHPQAADNFDLDGLVRLIPQALGINAAYMFPMDDVEAKRQQQEAEIRAQQQQAALVQAADIVTSIPQGQGQRREAA